MIPDEVKERAAQQLYELVGAFFTNTSRGPGRCQVCTGPAVEPLCTQCSNWHDVYGADLADLVVPLAYAKGYMSPLHQSAHHVTQYKNRIQPSAECQRDLALMVRVATLLHGECIAATAGWWDVLTFVPSAGRPGVAHPVVDLARAVAPLNPAPTKVLLDLGPDISSGPARYPLPHRFVVPEEYAPKVAGQHVLVVDDTWVSGDKPQSAALALRAAGARTVTLLLVARWLNWNYNEQHKKLISSLKEPYDARQCPVTGDACPTSVSHSR
ncbi:MAG: hypothetical protein JNM77_18920 [Pseudonocardia sp.]|nr:hypothetical protein [Pseudonocardia sp.]